MKEKKKKMCPLYHHREDDNWVSVSMVFCKCQNSQLGRNPSSSSIFHPFLCWFLLSINFSRKSSLTEAKPCPPQVPLVLWTFFWEYLQGVSAQRQININCTMDFTEVYTSWSFTCPGCMGAGTYRELKGDLSGRGNQVVTRMHPYKSIYDKLPKQMSQERDLNLQASGSW